MENGQQTPQNQTNNTTTNQQAQKPKKTRTRKTIEQELAELEAKRQRLLESKRKAEAHGKIIFGATVIAMLKNMQKNGDPLAKTISDRLKRFAKDEKSKDSEIIEKIIAPILEMKPEVNNQSQGQKQGNSQAQHHQDNLQQSSQHHSQSQHQQIQNRSRQQ